MSNKCKIYIEIDVVFDTDGVTPMSNYSKIDIDIKGMYSIDSMASIYSNSVDQLTEDLRESLQSVFEQGNSNN